MDIVHPPHQPKKPLHQWDFRRKIQSKGNKRFVRHSSLPQFAQTLRAARLRAGLTVRDLAEATGLTSSTISRLENGQIASPRPEKLVRLASVLNLSIDDLYAGAGYLAPHGLPELKPYLRAKYGLTGRPAEQLDEYFQALRGTWENPRKEGDHESNNPEGEHH